MICISSNNVRHPVTTTFTPLHQTSPSCTSLYFTTLVDTSLLPIQTSPSYTSLPSQLAELHSNVNVTWDSYSFILVLPSARCNKVYFDTEAPPFSRTLIPPATSRKIGRSYVLQRPTSAKCQTLYMVHFMFITFHSYECRMSAVPSTELTPVNGILWATDSKSLK
jgi:hypothetical protein